MSSQLQSKQVAPLPIGSGGNNASIQQLNNTNTQLTMMQAQSTADTKYDPPVPQPVTQPIVQPFCSNSMHSMELSTALAIIGSLCIVYGIVAK